MTEKEMSNMGFSRFAFVEYEIVLGSHFFTVEGGTMEIAVMAFADHAREWGAENGHPHLAKVTAEQIDEGVKLTAELLATEEEAMEYKRLMLLEQVGAITITDRWSERVER